MSAARPSSGAARRPGKLLAMTLDLEALETSFDLVAPRGYELVDVFYERLFAAAPAVRPLFAGTDPRRQNAMLLAALVLVRNSLRNLDAIVPKLRELGARHVGLRRSCPSTIRSSARSSSPRWPRSRATHGGRSTAAPGLRHSTSSPARCSTAPQPRCRAPAPRNSSGRSGKTLALRDGSAAAAWSAP